MNDFIKTLLSLSVSGSVLFLLLWGFKPLYKNQFSRRWQYYIWLVAALRFVLPFTPNTTIIGSLFTACSPDTFAATNTVQTFYSSIQAAPAAAQTPLICLFFYLLYGQQGSLQLSSEK
jgi:beta-lactamase regulating signal transducer with metallopeptidase domain